MTTPVTGRIPTLEDLGDVRGKRVLVRTDFNVPMDGDVITDDLRIRAALPTINWLVERGATVVVGSTVVVVATSEVLVAGTVVDADEARLLLPA